MPLGAKKLITQPEVVRPSMNGEQGRGAWHPQAQVLGETRRNASDFVATSLRLRNGNMSGFAATSKRLRGGNISDAVRLRHRLLKRAGTSATRWRQDDWRTRMRSGVSDVDIEIIQRILRRQQVEEQMARQPQGLVQGDSRQPVVMASPCASTPHRHQPTSVQHNGSVKSRDDPLPTVHEACSFEGKRGRGWWLASPKTDPSPLRVSVLTMVKNAVALLRDWVPYHLLLGIAHIYVVNNDCGAEAAEYGRCSTLKSYVHSGAVTLIDAAFRCRNVGRASMMGALAEQLMLLHYANAATPEDAARAADAAENEWILQIDPDEYVVLPAWDRAAAYFGKLLHVQPTVDSVLLPWRVFGTSFRANNTENGSLIANYQLRLPLALTLQGMTQLIDRQKRLDQINPFLGKEAVRLAALGNHSRCTDSSAAHEHLCKTTFDWISYRALAGANGSVVPRLAPVRAAVASAFIHHYTYLSDADWARKKERGRPRRGANFSRRRGVVDSLFSAVRDATILERVRLLAQAAHRWSAEPALARRCAAALQRGDGHFGPATDRAEIATVAPHAAARAALQTARVRHAAQDKEESALWFILHWAESGHSKSVLPREVASSLGAPPNETAREQTAARWLSARWSNSTAIRRNATAAIVHAVEGFAQQCMSDDGTTVIRQNGMTTRAQWNRQALCTGWTSLEEEQI